MQRNYWYKGKLFLISHSRSKYNYSKRYWEANENINGLVQFVCDSKISLKDIRQKVRQHVDEQKR